MAGTGRGDRRGRPYRTRRIVCAYILCLPLRSLTRCDIAVAAVEVVPVEAGDVWWPKGGNLIRRPSANGDVKSLLTARISCKGSLMVHRTFALSLGLFRVECVPGKKGGDGAREEEEEHHHQPGRPCALVLVQPCDVTSACVRYEARAAGPPFPFPLRSPIVSSVPWPGDSPLQSRAPTPGRMGGFSRH